MVVYLKNPAKKWLTLAAVVGLAYWFFGNLYEAAVFSPNWIVDSPTQVRRLHEFFVNTSPTLYFVPVTQIATLLVWVVSALNDDRELAPYYRRASFFALLVTVLNTFIVATLITRIFGADYLSHPESLFSYCWRWNVLNLFRMILVAITAFHTFNAFRILDRR